MKELKERNSQGSNAQAARLLRALAALIEKSGPEELNALLRGEASLSCTEKTHSIRAETPAARSNLPALAEQLQLLDSREAGHSLLTAMSLARRDLEGLGRVLGIPIFKNDNMERLTQKIIEAAIGSRLNSVAIRGDRRHESDNTEQHTQNIDKDQDRSHS